MRILCLHGRGTNSEIFENQLAPIISRLPKSFIFDFLDGEATVNAAPGIDAIHPGPYLAWHRRHFTDEIAAAHEYVNNVIEEDGPYDGVIGFSQGAALAASIILSHQLDASSDKPRPFNFAIFLCSVMPLPPSTEVGIDGTEYVVAYEKAFPDFFGLSEEEKAAEVSTSSLGQVAQLYEEMSPVGGDRSALQEEAHAKIDIPTLHLLGAEDQFLSFGQYVTGLCEERKAEVIISQGGHEVPRSEDFVERIVGLIESVVEQSKMDF